MNVRTYPVPRSITASASRVPTLPGVAESALRAARAGQVRGYHLALLASCERWTPGAGWAQSVLEREKSSEERKAEALLAAIGYDPESYVYQGVLDPGYPDHELIVSVARQADADSPLEKWDGVDWGTAEVSPEGLEYVVLDADVLVDVLDALESGSGGVMLRPFEPKAWTRDAEVLDYPVLAAAPPPQHTGAMVALPIDADTANELAVDGGEAPDQLHITLAYLGDTEEKAIDYQAVQRAVARWARRVGDLEGEVSGPAVFTAGEEPVSVALADIPDLPAAREMLIKLLEAEGVEVDHEHGYTPHITLAYDDEVRDVPNSQLAFDQVAAHYADDVTRYDLGGPVVAAGGAGPDILYAVVDEFDTNAVLDVIRIQPGPVAYRRSNGTWVKDQEMLMRLMGVDPPPVVEIRPEQAEDVLAQVDAYDTQHPAPVAAAAPVQWNEQLHPRQAGKFARKNGSPSGGRHPLARGPVRPIAHDLKRKDVDGRGDDGLSRKDRFPDPQRIKQQPWLALRFGNDLNHRDLDMGLGSEFWGKQPEGFRQWLLPSLRQMARDHVHGKKDWASSVPARYKKAMDEFTQAAAMKAAHPLQGQIEYGPGGKMSQNGPEDDRNRLAHLDKADRDFDLAFAKEGLGESRRRELFDRQLPHAAKRLHDAGVDQRRLVRLMQHRIQEEKQRRSDFERARRVRAEQERVRRMAAGNHEADRQSGLVADVSTMPAKLKNYWLHGEGAAKIRWGVSGDFNRCVRALAKYLNPAQVKGACANLHHLALGAYPGPGPGHGH